MDLAELNAYLDDYLRIDEIPDAPNAVNGLQVEGRRDVNKIATAVDACSATIRGAVREGADLLLVHHGLFWPGLRPLTGPRYRLLKALIEHGAALYSAHLPLDLHAEVGNNAVLLRKLGYAPWGAFGTVDEVEIGVWTEVDATRGELVENLKSVLGHEHVLPIVGGPERVRRLGLITGAAGSAIDEAFERGLDTFITGEAKHPEAVAAEEYGINLILGGHYATETVGVKALAEHLSERFGVEHVFIDHPFPT